MGLKDNIIQGKEIATPIYEKNRERGASSYEKTSRGYHACRGGFKSISI